ncbi:MAG: electron transfer flavoprotein-ubiquinone oxidoreductase [Gammaproteobacteria bacterium]|nr:electron transfer flavoprotein-ubiquinone oxidoreductase [Gammaproteobacteria bacterium]
MTERDVMQYDVVVVGGGPAGLSCAIRLKKKNPELAICLLEKGSEIGANILSGCVLEPGPLDELWPEWRDNPPSICVDATEDEFALLTETGRRKLPTPPQQNNHGNVIVSLGSLCQRLAEQAEALEIDVFPGFPAAEALIEDGKVIGVRCGDMGLEKDSQFGEKPGPNYAPGVDIHAKLTVLAEGCRGSVSKQLIREFELDKDAEPQTYGLGFKELWQLPEGRVKPGRIEHTLGWPLQSGTYGGSFLYHLDEDRVYVGFIVGLDYEHPEFKPFEAFQQFKHHPSVKQLLEGGEIVSSGARTVVKGGLQSLPKMDIPGAMLIGDAAGTLNFAKIKGVHMALKSGMLAADHYIATAESSGWDAAFRKSDAAKELKKVRNIAPGFKKGMWFGLVNAAFETVTMGLAPWTLKHGKPDWKKLQKLDEAGDVPQHIGERDLPPKDRLASVYFAATEHDESQPPHLKISDTDICIDRCTEEYGNPCERFCPAGVYEIVETDGERRMQVNAANCVHCKACDIKDPYEIITWTTPEGGSGPNYQNL